MGALAHSVGKRCRDGNMPAAFNPRRLLDIEAEPQVQVLVSAYIYNALVDKFSDKDISSNIFLNKTDEANIFLAVLIKQTPIITPYK